MARKGVGQRRQRRPVRHSPRRILVVCGGAVTQPQYFKGLRDHVGSRVVHIKVLVEDKSPHYAVEKAADDLQTGDFDEAWCVFDVDRFDWQPAVCRAARQNVNVALSNPCFDLWLLLHHADCSAYIEGYEKVRDRLRKQKGLKRFGSSDAAKSVDFVKFRDGIDDAIGRAQMLDTRHSKPHSNPSTGVWRPVKLIMENPG